MSEHRALQELLQQNLEDTRLDSRGVFTLAVNSLHPRLQTLAQHHAASPWLLAVQAAVLLGAPAVHLEVGRQLIGCSFTLPDWPSELEQIGQSLHKGQPSAAESAGVEHLRSALTWALSQEQGEVGLLLQTEGRAILFHGTLSSLQQRDAELRQPRRVSLICRLVKPSSKLRAELAHEFAQRLRFCPIPVLLDQQPLTTGSLLAQRQVFRGYWLAPPQNGSWIAATHPRNQTAKRYLLGQLIPGHAQGELDTLALLGSLPEDAELVPESSGFGLPVAAWESPQGQRSLFLRGSWLPGAALHPGPHLRLLCRGMLERGASSPELSHRLLIARHGVLCDPLSLVYGHTHDWTAVLAADQTRVDLSRFKLVSDPYLTNLSDWVRTQIYQVHQTLGTVSQESPPTAGPA